MTSSDVTLHINGTTGARSYVLALVESTDKWQQTFYLTGDRLDWAALDWQTRSFLAGAAQHVLDQLARTTPATPSPRPNGA